MYHRDESIKLSKLARSMPWTHRLHSQTTTCLLHAASSSSGRSLGPSRVDGSVVRILCQKSLAANQVQVGRETKEWNRMHTYLLISEFFFKRRFENKTWWITTFYFYRCCLDIYSRVQVEKYWNATTNTIRNLLIISLCFRIAPEWMLKTKTQNSVL
jgi:hypothetical protein